MKKIKLIVISLTMTALMGASALAEIKSMHVSQDLSKLPVVDAVWEKAPSEIVSLMAQPMAVPRPKQTTTSLIQVQSVNDGKWIAFRLKWKADSKNEAGKLGQFSDAVAMQFPAKEGPPPPIFMGGKDQSVHIFHWRAQYQKDVEKGKPTVKSLYPNMNTDMYPMEFPDQGSLKGLTDEKRETYSPGKSSGNPQSYEKVGAVDEIFAEGFGSSAVIENRMSAGQGFWNKGEWTVVITRAMKRENGSTLEAGKDSFVGFAVWQGSKQEAGSRKSVTMSWTPIKVNQ